MFFNSKYRNAVISLAAAISISSGVVATQAAAEGYHVGDTAITANFPNWDRLNIRKWPASYSQKVAHIKRDRVVFVERCIIKSGADWCKIRKGSKRGWVNGKFIQTGLYNYASPHPWF